jgi:hypothetical protein
MDLPSFLWLWKIAAWSMGLAVFAYLLQTISGVWIYAKRVENQPRPNWLKPLHYLTGVMMVLLVLLLLGIGVVGTIGHYGNLGHSSHLWAGILVVILVLLSAASAYLIQQEGYAFARGLHLGINLVLLAGFIFVSFSGWEVVQKYLD